MNLATPLLRWLTLLSPVCCCLFAARGILHFFQLESYQFPGYFRSLKRNRVHSLLPGLCVTVTVLVLLYGFDVLALRGEARWTGILAAVLLLPLSAGAGLVCRYALGGSACAVAAGAAAGGGPERPFGLAD